MFLSSLRLICTMHYHAKCWQPCQKRSTTLKGFLEVPVTVTGVPDTILLASFFCRFSDYKNGSGKKCVTTPYYTVLIRESETGEREEIQNVLPCCHKVNWLQSPFSRRFSSSGRKRLLFLSITASPSSRMSFQFFSKDCWESHVTALRTYCVWLQYCFCFSLRLLTFFF